jgi:pimeloyl-ACP methyl ester carboxylesterase
MARTVRREKGHNMTRNSMFRLRALRWPLTGMAIACVAVLTMTSLASAESRSATNTAQTKPTIVLVHGGWADGSNPLRSLAGDSAYLASYLKTIAGPIVLVGHSYGGAVITNAATGNADVRALAYIDAFAPAQGESLQQLTFAKPGSCLTGGGDLSNVFNFVVDPSQPTGDPDLYLKVAPGTDYLGFARCFANEVPAKQVAVLAAVQRPFALGAFTEPSAAPAWTTIPSWALIGRHDRAIPPAELTFMAKRAGAHIESVDGGHLSLISDPSDTARLIVRAANATSQERGHEH